MNFTGGRKTVITNDLPIVADSISLGSILVGKGIISISAVDSLGAIVAGASLTALVANITGGTVWEREYLAKDLNGNGDGFLVLCMANWAQYTSNDLVIDFFPASGLVSMHILTI